MSKLWGMCYDRYAAGQQAAAMLLRLITAREDVPPAVRMPSVFHPENRICDSPSACGVARSSKWREPFRRIVRLAAGPQLRFSGNQMGGQKRQQKINNSRRSGGFTNSTAFSSFNPATLSFASRHQHNFAVRRAAHPLVDIADLVMMARHVDCASSAGHAP